MPSGMRPSSYESRTTWYGPATSAVMYVEIFAVGGNVKTPPSLANATEEMEKFGSSEPVTGR